MHMHMPSLMMHVALLEGQSGCKSGQEVGVSKIVLKINTEGNKEVYIAHLTASLVHHENSKQSILGTWVMGMAS